jgi:hypothetical protein
VGEFIFKSALLEASNIPIYPVAKPSQSPDLLYQPLFVSSPFHPLHSLVEVYSNIGHRTLGEPRVCQSKKKIKKIRKIRASLDGMLVKGVRCAVGSSSQMSMMMP